MRGKPSRQPPKPCTIDASKAVFPAGHVIPKEAFKAILAYMEIAKKERESR